MKSSLYEEIVAAMREGKSKEDIISLVNEAEIQLKAENDQSKESLDEARANLLESLYKYYEVLGVEIQEEDKEKMLGMLKVIE